MSRRGPKAKFPRRSEIPHGRGQRRGEDAWSGQEESWAIRARESNPDAAEWFISSFPFHANDAVVVTGALGAALQLNMLPSLSGVIEVTSARIKIYTQDSGKTIRACIYRFDTSQKTKQFVKVPNTDVTFDVSAQYRTTPLDVKLDGVARLTPGYPYFLGTRANSGTVRVPVTTAQNVCHFPSYQIPVEDGPLPGRLNISDLDKNYDGYVPWITYLSKEAEQLL